MRTRLTFKSTPLLKWTILSVLWILSFLILVALSANNGLNTLYNDITGSGSEFRLVRNQLGALSYTHCDPRKNYRPVYSASLKKLRAENNKLGIFKTALHKVVKIEGLELRFYQYSSPSKNITTYPYGLIKDVARKLGNPVDRWRFNIDLSNVSEVRIYNFDYKVFYDGDLFLAIQSKRATTSYKNSGVALRGHVTIETADGSTLESNRVKWDMENQHFIVNGMYILNRRGARIVGKNICVDAQLNNVQVKRAKVYQKEEQECFAKL